MHKLSRGRQLRLICRRQLLVTDVVVAAANVDVFLTVVAVAIVVVVAAVLQLLMFVH